jgi:Icc-related predicted phosphoesterase
VIRIAAVGDLHLGLDSPTAFGDCVDQLTEEADVLLLAGDLTRVGRAAEVRVLADELRDLRLPAVAVLGNHDFHGREETKIAGILGDAGVRVLEGNAVSFDVRGVRVGIAGTKGFGGGFGAATIAAFGEAEIKSFVRHGRRVADQLRQNLAGLDADVRLALLHYSPCRATLEGENPELYPFLGSSLLGQAVDEVGVDLVVHGHAHEGTERGETAGGTAVRNVARPVLERSYGMYVLDSSGLSRAGAQAYGRLSRLEPAERW